MSEEEWNFKAKDDLIYIENISKTMTLQANSYLVDLEDFEEDEAEQLWKKGEPNGEGYFTLKNSKWPRFLRADSDGDLIIEGKVTLR